MGIEYYLVKPDRQEIFYLGKHFVCPEGISNFMYKNKAEYLEYPDFDEFFWDILKNNWDYFVYCDITLLQTYYIISTIYEWCDGNEVYLDNDCSNNAITWLNWKETGDITKILESVHDETEASNNIGRI